MQDPPKNVMSSNAMNPLARLEPQIPSMTICRKIYDFGEFYVENLKKEVERDTHRIVGLVY